MLKLVGTDGNRYYTFQLKPGKYIIGRKENCDFCIGHKTVSGNHAEISINDSGEGITLRDLGSKNGTVVNDLKIQDSIELKEQDRIMFGSTEFRIQSEDKPSEVTSHKVTLSKDIPENSIFMPIDETMRPLPQKLADVPELVPTIFDMARLLALDEPKEALLEKSLELISKVIPAERLLIIFVSGDQEDIRVGASHLSAGNDDELRLSKTIVVDIIENKNSLLIRNPLSDPKFADKQSIIMSEMKSAMAVPLFDEGRVLGILYADTTNPMHTYNDSYLRILATFGNIIASRLLNYALLEERQAKQLLNAELEKASSIQRNLLPSESPKIEGYSLYAYQEQTRLVGGDLYDWKVLVDGSLIFLLGDVSGKGMGAAILMSNILAAFRVLYENEIIKPAEVVKRVSMQLHDYSKSNNFVTLFVGILNPANGKIRYANAGHNPPVLIRSDGKYEYLEATGMMAGAFDFTTWEEKTVDLQEGDLLFIFSDGVTEADRDGAGDQYGDERTEKAALVYKDKNPQQFIEEMAGEIERFMGDAPQSDDITMMALKRL
jgi:sigma-B regulation protein RsbU (phosphoserine phosphatase)